MHVCVLCSAIKLYIYIYSTPQTVFLDLSTCFLNVHILSLIVFLLHLRVWSKKEHLLQDSTISGLHGFSDLTSSIFWILSLSSYSHPSNYFWAGSHLRFCFTCQKCSSHRLIWLAPPYPSDSCSYIKQLVRQILSILYKIVITLLSTNRHLALSICVMFVQIWTVESGIEFVIIHRHRQYRSNVIWLWLFFVSSLYSCQYFLKLLQRQT